MLDEVDNNNDVVLNKVYLLRDYTVFVYVTLHRRTYRKDTTDDTEHADDTHYTRDITCKIQGNNRSNFINKHIYRQSGQLVTNWEVSDKR